MRSPAHLPMAICIALITGLGSYSAPPRSQVPCSVLMPPACCPATFILLRPTPSPRAARVYRRHVTHTLTDFKGTSYSYSFSNRLGVLVSMVIGGISSMFGIGGGPFQVPVLVYLQIGR